MFSYVCAPQNDCQYVGCGESFSDHSTQHAQVKPSLVSHRLCLNGDNGSDISVQRSSNDCTLVFQVKKHNLTVNLTTFRIWCYVCEREVFLEHRASLVPVPAAPHHCKVLEQVLFQSLGTLFQICMASFLIRLIFIVQHDRFPRKQLLSQSAMQ